MHDGLDARVGDQLPERGEVEAFGRIDQRDRFAVGHLHQAQDGVVGVVADELGVECEAAGLFERATAGLEFALFGNEVADRVLCHEFLFKPCLGPTVAATAAVGGPGGS